MRILHTIAGLDPRLGGGVRIVSRLTECLAADGRFSVSLLSQGVVGEPILPTTSRALDRRIAMSRSRAAVQSGLLLRNLVVEAVRSSPPRLIHDHGIWKPSNHWVAAIARRHGIPLAIHVHGALEPWALSYGAWKKRPAFVAYQRRDLESAAVLFVTAEQEAENVRRLGITPPLAIIPNGVDLPVLGTLAARPNITANVTRNAVFLGRIHPIKGLLNLIEAWARLKPAGWRLRVAGPDVVGHLAVVMRRVRELELESSVDWLGEVEGDRKTDLLASAELLILPSFCENFGVVVAEALAHGVPVITTRGTPWAVLKQHGCGWWVEPTVDALTYALREAHDMDACALRVMGEKGRAYVHAFNWNDIASKFTAVYLWVLGHHSKPDCVMVD